MNSSDGCVELFGERVVAAEAGELYVGQPRGEEAQSTHVMHARKGGAGGLRASRGGWVWVGHILHMAVSATGFSDPFTRMPRVSVTCSLLQKRPSGPVAESRV